ncbi:MAG: hypothetical protein LBT96_01380, partial [Campylobacteraceae bacterium]|nr:hypothetical protein [Campylobacteraceae bacterium]
RVPQRPKQNKNTRASQRDGTTSAASSLPLSCLLKKDGRKAFRLCEIKGIGKRGGIFFVLICENEKIQSFKYEHCVLFDCSLCSQ